MCREDSLVQLPSEIIHISLQQPSPPVPAALSGTSIKAKVLNALATVLNERPEHGELWQCTGVSGYPSRYRWCMHSA